MAETLLDQIIADSITSGVSVGDLVRKVWFLGRTIGHDATVQWADKELNGYPLTAAVPKYRGPYPLYVTGDFHGYGPSVLNQQLTYEAFDKETNAHLYSTRFRQPLAELENLSQGKKSLEIRWPNPAVGEYNRLADQGKVAHFPGRQLNSARGIISVSTVHGILDSIKSATLALAVDLQQVAPAAGDVASISLQDEKVRQVLMQFNTNIYGNQNTVGQGETVKQKVTNTADDASTAIGQLQTQFGVSQENAAELVEAVQEDGGQIGENTKSWFQKVRSGAVRVAEGVTVESIASWLVAASGLIVL